jgi:outer membrane protein assembly factor BamC
MHAVLSSMSARAILAAACALLTLAGCETGSSLGKKIDYKSVSTAPALEVPPDLTTPTYDDKYNVATASGLAARDATRPKDGSEIAPNAIPEARVMHSGAERWLVVKASPQAAWNTTRAFWPEMGFVLAVEQPDLGVMETDWAENKAEAPSDLVRKSVGQFADIFFSTYKRDKYRTRIERGSEPGTMEIYISHRGMEQVPTVKMDNVSPAGFQWAVMPPNPGLEAEMLTRLMMKFGTNENAATQAVRAATNPAPAAEHARIDKGTDGAPRLYVDESFDRTWRRVGLALDRIGFTVVDRDRSKGLYYVRYADTDLDTAKDTSFMSKLMFWKDKTEKPEQYRIFVAEADPRSLVTVQDQNGVTDKSAASEKILALLKEQLK